MSFRLKIILGVTAIQTVLLVILIWNGLNVLQASSEEALLKRTYTITKLFATSTQAAVLATDLATLESFLGELLSNPGIVYARVLTKQGVLAERGEKQALAKKFVADTSLASTANDDVFDAYADIAVSGEHYGRVEIGFSTLAIEQLISHDLPEMFDLSDTCLRIWVQPSEQSSQANLVFSETSEEVKTWIASRTQAYCGKPPAIVGENWFIEPAASLAIIGLHQTNLFGFLALASDSDNRFYEEMGTDFLTKMSELISAALSRHLMLP